MASSLLADVDELLRARADLQPGAARAVPTRRMLLLLVVCTLLYGAVMGTYAGRPLQSLYSALKVPALLLITSSLVLPSFFVINTLLGLRDDFEEAFRAIIATQVVVAIALASLAPLVLVAYASFDHYPNAVRANAVFFGLATIAGHVSCEKLYRPLVRRNARHQIGRWSWALLYVFVGIQLGWVLRPFVGDPRLPLGFLRQDAWSNAYVVILRDVLGVGG